MVIYRLPPDSDAPKNSSSKKEKEEIHHVPEFVYIDDEDTYEYESTFSGMREKGSDSLQDLVKRRYPAKLRVITFFISLLALLFTCVTLIFLTLYVCLSGLLLFQNDRLNFYLKKCFNVFKKSLVFFLGFFVATLSPGFGFGIIILYFIMQGEKMSDPVMGRIFQMYKNI